MKGLADWELNMKKMYESNSPPIIFTNVRTEVLCYKIMIKLLLGVEVGMGVEWHNSSPSSWFSHQNSADLTAAHSFSVPLYSRYQQNHIFPFKPDALIPSCSLSLLYKRSSLKSEPSVKKKSSVFVFPRVYRCFLNNGRPSQNLKSHLTL